MTLFKTAKQMFLYKLVVPLMFPTFLLIRKRDS